MTDHGTAQTCPQCGMPMSRKVIVPGLLFLHLMRGHETDGAECRALVEANRRVKELERALTTCQQQRDQYVGELVYINNPDANVDQRRNYAIARIAGLNAELEYVNE